MEQEPNHIAVYGTLRRDLGKKGNYHLLDGEKSTRFIGHGKIKGVMLNFGAYPGLLPETAHTTIVEIHEVLEGRQEELFARLDRYEGYRKDHPDNSLFMRDKVTLIAPKDFPVWVYYYNFKPKVIPPYPQTRDWLANMTGKATKYEEADL